MFHFATSEPTHFLSIYGYWAVLLFIITFLVFVRRNKQRLEAARHSLPLNTSSPAS